LSISSNYFGQNNVIGQAPPVVASTKDEWLVCHTMVFLATTSYNCPKKKTGQNNQEICELTVLSNCALVAPHFNAIAIPYWSPILISWINREFLSLIEIEINKEKQRALTYRSTVTNN
jgi:hypothetical protein